MTRHVLSQADEAELLRDSALIRAGVKEPAAHATPWDAAPSWEDLCYDEDYSQPSPAKPGESHFWEECGTWIAAMVMALWLLGWVVRHMAECADLRAGMVL